jgi:hypothetical protein
MSVESSSVSKDLEHDKEDDDDDEDEEEEKDEPIKEQMTCALTCQQREHLLKQLAQLREDGLDQKFMPKQNVAAAAAASVEEKSDHEKLGEQGNYCLLNYNSYCTHVLCQLNVFSAAHSCNCTLRTIWPRHPPCTSWRFMYRISNLL